MTKIVQLSGGSRESQDAYTGPERELTVDIDGDELRLHDGIKVGGHRILPLTSLVSLFQGINNFLDSLAGLAGTSRGLLVKTGAAESRVAEIKGTAGQVQVTNGNAVNADPVISLPGVITSPLTFSSGIQGNLVGNVTGDVTGDLTGDVTGNVEGDLIGDVTGNITGNVAGTLVGSIDVAAGSVNFAPNQIPQNAVQFLSGITLQDLVPAGAIIMWSGSLIEIPAGWALCDGTNGTPDMRDKFAVGAGLAFAVGAVGGSATHDHNDATLSQQPAHSHTITVGQTALTVGQMPAHQHRAIQVNSNGVPLGVFGTEEPEVTDGRRVDTENGAVAITLTESIGGGETHGHSGASSSEAAHTHTITSSAKNHLPPYYAIAFIMKL